MVDRRPGEKWNGTPTMVRSTDKTIQDYFKPTTALPQRAITRSAGTASFTSILRGTLSPTRLTSDGEVTGRTIRDYMQCSFGAVTPGVTPFAGDQKPLADHSDRVAGTHGEIPAHEFSHKEVTADAAQANSRAEERRTIERAVRHAADKYGLPAGLIRSVIRCESNFKPDALSHAGAQGLMQLMPATASDLGVSDPFDIQQNIDGGARYLRQMIDRFDGDIETALAAYNAGPGTVSRYGGVPPYRETQAYVKKVMRYADLGKAAIVG